MKYLKAAVSDMQHKELTELELGIEGFASFDEFLYSVKRVFRDRLTVILNENYPAVELKPTPCKSFLQLLKKADKDFIDLEKINVYRTENLTSTNGVLAELLYDHSKDVYSIIDRVYAPMNKWFAGAITRDGFSGSLWNDRDLDILPLEKMKEALAKCFRKKRISYSDVDMIPMGDLYVNEKQFIETNKFLDEIYENANGFHLNLLSEAEERLTDYITTITSDEDIDIPKATKQKIVSVIRAIIDETEYLVAFNFMTISTIKAWNDSILKLEAELSAED